MRHYTDWHTGVKDGRYGRARLTWHQWQQVTRSYTPERQRLSRRAYLRGYRRGQYSRAAYASTEI